MNKRYKWKFTKATFALLLTSVFALLGICLFGLNELTHYYGVTGLFTLKEVPDLLLNGLKDSFVLNYKYYITLQLVVISLLGFVGLLILLCMIFRLKISNLYALLLWAIGGAAMLSVTTITFVFVKDPITFALIKQLMLFKNIDFSTIKDTYGVVIQGAGLWLTALCMVGMLFEFVAFIYFGIREGINKIPHLKGDAKYYYKHFDKEELSYIAANNSNKNVVVKNQNGAVRRSGTRNNVTVTRGMPIPERSTNVVQFVNCDDTFVDQIKSKEEKAKGATFLELGK